MSQVVTESVIIPWRQLSESEKKHWLSRVVDTLCNDQLVVLPTETRYALVARADSQAAIENIVNAKERAASQPLSIFLPSVEHIARYARVTPLSTRFAHAWLPGPLTLVMASSVSLPEAIVQNQTVGIRVSPEPILKMLFEYASFPLTATSANRSGMTECTTIDEIQNQLGESVTLYLDDGIRNGKTSTVVDVRSEEPVILREGQISADQVHMTANGKMK